MVRPVSMGEDRQGPVQEAQADPMGANESSEAPGRRLTFGLEDLELDEHLSPTQMNEQEFLSLCRTDPQRLFDRMYEQQDKSAQQAEDLRIQNEKEQQSLMVEVANLKQTIRDQTAAMRELIEERDTAQDRADRTGWGTPAPEGKHTKSTKLPDGQVLVDGKDPKFESWLIDVEGKLEANADHYPTAQARMAYVKSMCKGEAANHLLARMRKDSPDRYHDVDDIFDHLRTLYQDANRVINAKMELRRLMMRDTKFQPFLSQFVLLAQDAGLATSEWKEDLFYKLSFELQRAMIKESNDPRVSYQEFVKECSTTANRLEQINTSEKRARPHLFIPKAILSRPKKVSTEHQKDADRRDGLFNEEIRQEATGEALSRGVGKDEPTVEQRA
ncbi:uncharacterized protein TRUGW13939_11249 [Talaromyces rugulosus]|uniref:Retrotransposon gag domain-containing protein n=1 Tax=Talaromyces rugulosus TaxID=121627 RepID=A0A7H8R4V8_TALRU|nr:uncharacterized protein TRUGW13939_05562 [Talaromyces rugulosus]XP_035347593.1 uncharacterized protein TRUGW13939_08567 [Talaromyces rugulosus]XP_035348327.1 uncharacterized protein TRUGW13939_09310 [Talaromyces rugulosus]XP_035348692.1 uncharacterized protein TRUGW13939_09679 [Talaromyces rugulosus]XP_035350250.1 uncharacterized protein TRUGW13939_11249 [Talaromyces rugulosus]QKX58439.1 hypothetical protein TRUGW13939_05562 [Talaromyces rugulosus]QKX61419.1 hypothetical protein TRUGW13939